MPAFITYAAEATFCFDQWQQYKNYLDKNNNFPNKIGGTAYFAS